MSNMICIGGPMHGMRKQVEQGRRTFETVERPPLPPVSRILEKEGHEEEVTYKRHLYEREVIGAGEKSITFWRHSELPVGQVAHYLISDFSENAPHIKAATLMWVLRQIEEVIRTKDSFREAPEAILKIIIPILYPKPGS
jgi:hypothetical protein